MVGGHLQSVDVGQRAERRGAGDEEVAEQFRIRRARRRHVHEEAVERLRLFRRRQEIDVIADAHRLGFRRRQYLFLADHQTLAAPSSG